MRPSGNGIFVKSLAVMPNRSQPFPDSFVFQYFGNKQALYQYLLDYCTAQMKQAYDANTLEENTDFFDRVWEASVMKVENLKQHPHIGSFIASAAVKPAPKA